jgi:hypothetical protein
MGVTGFMSATNLAINIEHGDTKNLATLSSDDQIIAVRRFCKKHPNEQVMDGVVELFKGLSSNADAE